MPNILFFDIDGTLIDVSQQMHTPSQETICAIHQYQAKGNLLFIATSRGSLPNGLQSIPFDGYIFNDGHQIVVNNEHWVNDLFTQEDIHYLSTHFKKNNAAYYWAHRKTHYNKYNHSPLMQLHNTLYIGSTHMDAIETYDNSEIIADSTCAMFNTKEELYACLKLIEGKYSVNAYDTGCIRMDVYPKGFNKGSACHYVYTRLNIDKNNTYAFGDGLNDIEMLQEVGCGIAMNNACDTVKQVADYVTTSVLENGIVHALKHFKLID